MKTSPVSAARPAPAAAWWRSLGRLAPWLGWGVLGLLVLLAALGPLYLSAFDLVLAFTLFNYMTMAQSWNLLGGYGGQFSLGHSLFVGAGSYTIAVLLLHSGLPLLLDLLLSGLLAAALATLAALLLMRLREAYFSIGSLGLAMAALTWMLNWSFTGATSGLNLPPAATLDYSTLYYLALGLLVATTLTIVLLVRSPFGLRLMAIRDDQEAAAELGVNSFPVKLVTFAISAFFVGLAGGLIALNKLEIEPDSAFSMNWVITMIIITIIGGIATSTGPLLGAVVFFTLQQVLQNSQALSSLLTGLLLILIIRLAPEGLWPLVLNVGRRLGEALVSRFAHSEPTTATATATTLTAEEAVSGGPTLGDG